MKFTISLFSTTGNDLRYNKVNQKLVHDTSLTYLESNNEMFDISKNQTGGNNKDSLQTHNTEEGVSNTTIVFPNDIEIESGDDEDDDVDNDDDDDDNGDDNDVKKFPTSVHFQHGDEDDDENHDEQEPDDIETAIDNDHIWSMSLPTKEATESLQNLKWTFNNTRNKKPKQTETTAYEPKIVIANLSRTMPEVNEEDHTSLPPKKLLNTEVNQRNGSSEMSGRILNLTDFDMSRRKSVVRPVHETSSYQTWRSRTIKPMPPPLGFSKTVIPNADIPSPVFNETVDDMEYYSRPSICPILEIRKSRQWSGNASCVPREVSPNACMKASKEYDLSSEPLNCGNKSDQQICSYKVIRQFAIQNKATIECNTSTCGSNPVYVLEFSPVFGILEDRHLWKRFFTTEGLEQHLEKYANASTAHGFNFCLLACVLKERTGYVEQLFTFHSLLKTSDSMLQDEVNFNLNILVLDSVSRPHFYRSLPKTVNSLREIVQFESYNATVLDFEMMQSTAAYTFHNIRALLSGKMDFHYSGGHINESYGIDVLFGKFKKLGYYTLLQEDSCWYDSWGSLFTDNKYQGSKPRDKPEFARRWKKFRDMVKYYNIDDFGLSHASCEVLKRYNTTNQFNHPRKVCFGGKAFAESFLDYAESIYDDLKAVGKKMRVLTYTHLNTGHEVSGTRIRQIDGQLSRYIEKMATTEETLTVVLSDHGPKTTGYSFHTVEGRAEKYDPFLFIVIPNKVAHALGLETVRALIQNQKRLITTLDLHNAFMSLGRAGLTGRTGIASGFHERGIFGLIPANRTCADLSMKPLAVCKCEGWEERFPDNDNQFTWLAEFALGKINNEIQRQYLRGGRETKGYGNCQRLAGKRFLNIRQRSEGGKFITTLDIPVTPGNEIFEVQIKHSQSPKKQPSFIKIVQRERITIYRHFQKCADSSVTLGLCVCDTSNSQKKPTKRKLHKWIKITRRQDILDIISLSKSFGAETKVKDIHDGCLLLMYRNHAGRSTSFEIANTCNDRTYSVSISTTNAEQYFISRRIPFSIFVQQRTIHFLLVVSKSEKSSHNFKLKVSYLIKNI